MSNHNEVNGRDSGPWYKQAWAWFVITPLIVVLFSSSTLVTLAYKMSDDVVIDNYYKEGRMINQRLDADLLAKEMKVQGELLVDLDVGELLLTLSASELPESLILHLDNPVEADLDQEFTLTEIAPGRYRADLNHRIDHRWYLRLEPASGERRWRVLGELDLQRTRKVMFGADE